MKLKPGMLLKLLNTSYTFNKLVINTQSGQGENMLKELHKTREPPEPPDIPRPWPDDDEELNQIEKL